MKRLLALGRGMAARVTEKKSRRIHEMNLVRPEFDTGFYLSQLGHGAIPPDPLRHFMQDGWKDGLDPNPDFSCQAYLDMHLDVADAGLNPLVHYISYGKTEGREVSASRHSTAEAVVQDTTQNLANDAAEMAAEIDLPFYSAISGQTFDDAVAAARHYLQIGWDQGLDPTPGFSTRAYLNHYPDIADANIAPFLHYIRAGRAEGRLALDRSEDVARSLAATPDLKTLEKDWLYAHPAQAALPRELGAQKLLAALAETKDRLVFAFTHDDFTQVRGGVQLCIGKEAAIAETEGCGYIALHPVRPRPRLAPIGESPAVFATVAGERIGPLSIDSLLDVARRFRDSRKIDIVLHALLGHSPEDVAALAMAAQSKRLFAWLHDQFFLCPSYALQSNLVRPCGAPEPSSAACRMCLFGEERHDHLRRLRALAQHIPMLALAPSKPAADIVFAKGDMPFEAIRILPHETLSEDPATILKGPGMTRPTTIAFIGAPKRHKGYHVFRDIARQNLGRNDLRFLYFGAAAHHEPGIPTIPVNVTADQPDAMVEALRDENVDFVIHWAQFTETFSFATIEALRAGADVLTHANSGNVAALVHQTGRGRVLDNSKHLQAFLNAKDLQKATRARRKKRAGFVSTESRLSFEVLDLAPPKTKPKARPRKSARAAKVAS